MAGYDLAQKLAHTRDKCLGLHPDLLILGYSLNDPQLHLAPLINDLGQISSGASGGRRMREWVKHNTALGMWGGVTWTRTFGGQRLLPTYAPRSPEWISARAQLKEFSLLSLENGVFPLVAILPAPFRLNNGHPYLPIYRILESFLEEEGIAWTNLLPSILGEKKREMIVCSCDFHLQRPLLRSLCRCAPSGADRASTVPRPVTA